MENESRTYSESRNTKPNNSPIRSRLNEAMYAQSYDSTYYYRTYDHCP